MREWDDSRSRGAICGIRVISEAISRGKGSADGEQIAVQLRFLDKGRSTRCDVM